MGATTPQRSLKRKAGASAQRPLTRSSLKPRLLFPSEEQQLERGLDDIDEEAVTDIEMPNASSSSFAQNATSPADMDVETPRPARSNIGHATPPPSKKSPSKRKQHAAIESTPVIYEDEPEPMSMSTSVGTADDTFPTAKATKRGESKSPFDAWQRTKTGKKRAAELASDGAEGSRSGKRTRSRQGVRGGSPV